MKKEIVLYTLGIIFCLPSILSAYFEFPYRGFWDSNETYFVMFSLIAPMFFLSSFYFLKLNYGNHLLLYFGMFGSVYLSIPDINLQYLDDIHFENREPSYSNGAVAFFILTTLFFVYLLIWNKTNYQTTKSKSLS